MTQDNTYHGGLIVLGREDSVIERLIKIVASTMEDYGHPVERKHRQGIRDAQVTATHYRAHLSLTQSMAIGDHGQRGITLPGFAAAAPNAKRDPQRQWRVTIELTPADPLRDDPDISELLLVVMLYRMTEQFDVSMVEWLDPLTLLTTEQFLDAFSNISPGAVAPSHPDETPTPVRAATQPRNIRLMGHEGLRSAFRSQHVFQELVPANEDDEDTQSDVQRLAIWGMTGMLAFLSGPVAVSMAAVNLIKGEDLRLNTHVLALTGFVSMVIGSGALEKVAHHLPL